MKVNMDNVYIKNHAELVALGGDMGVTMDKFDAKHNLEYDEVARVEYKYWRSQETGVKNLLSIRDKQIIKMLKEKRKAQMELNKAEEQLTNFVTKD